MSNVFTAIEMITPEKAQAYLAFNTNNRNLRRSHVDRLASDILSNRWIFNGATIVFNGDGTLLDGQHRLAAIVQAGIPVTMAVVRGVSKSAMSTIDANVSRKAGDVFKLNGVMYATRVVSASRQLIALRDNITTRHRATSSSELMAFALKHPHLQDAAIEVDKTTHVIQSSVVIPWFYLAKYVSGMAPEAESALAVLATGVPAYRGDPVHVFRERMIKMPTAMKSHERERLLLLWTMIAAWNDFIAGEKATICRLRQTSVQMTGVDYSSL